MTPVKDAETMVLTRYPSIDPLYILTTLSPDKKTLHDIVDATSTSFKDSETKVLTRHPSIDPLYILNNPCPQRLIQGPIVGSRQLPRDPWSYCS